MSNRTAEILLDAAEVIEKRGWFRSGYAPSHRGVDRKTCPVCVLAAINVAAGHEPTAEPWFGWADPALAAAEALARHLGYGDRIQAEGVVDLLGDRWNDATATSAKQVITALRECAASLKAGA